MFEIKRPGEPWFCWVRWRCGVWFRIKDYGLSIDNQEPYFSERTGRKKVLRVFGWAVQVLKP